MKKSSQITSLLCLLIAGCGGSGNTPTLVNAAPTISAIADQSTMANATSAAIGFTVTDDNTANLALSVSSDNQAVFPDSGLSLGIDGTAGSVTATPVIDSLGDAFVTVLVSDQAGLSASASFLLTVVPQQASVQQFVRSEFAMVEGGDPALVNAVSFDQDADDDEFADLLEP